MTNIDRVRLLDDDKMIQFLFGVYRLGVQRFISGQCDIESSLDDLIESIEKGEFKPDA